MISRPGTRTFDPHTILTVALALSIGWGIRGNFGHENGAMLPGALAALAVCLMSGREDWRQRAIYFAFFGALGWAFGGSISYMKVITYTHSGHLPTVYYGYAGLVVIGALWAGLGGAGTAFPAVATRAQMTGLLRPILWVFAAWVVLVPISEPLFEDWNSIGDATWSRHQVFFYWFDSDWLQAIFALVGVALFDLYERAGRGRRRALAIVYALTMLLFLAAGFWRMASAEVAMLFWLGALAVLGAGIFVTYPRLAGYTAGVAALGGLLQQVLLLVGLGPFFQWLLVHPQIAPEKAAEIAASRGLAVADIQHEFLTNWPNFFTDSPQHVGWFIGFTLGAFLYFRRFGRFRSGASLVVYMGTGFLLAMLLLPGFFSLGGGGLRMTPPRGDNWAGILGVYLATLLWLYRNRLVPVAYASLICAGFGGFAFAFTAFLKLMLMSLGHPHLGLPPETVAAWAHFQGANWHSFLEQTYGFLNGVGLALAMAFLAARMGQTRGTEPGPRWAGGFATAFVLLGIIYVNLLETPGRLIAQKMLPEVMVMPLVQQIALAPAMWLSLVFALLAVAGAYVIRHHRRYPLALVPAEPLGRAQMLFLMFLWSVVLMNLLQGLTGMSDGRLLTEGAVTVNAILVSVLVLTESGRGVTPAFLGRFDYSRDLFRVAVFLLLALLSTLAMGYGTRAVYGDTAYHPGIKEIRFGERAEWRLRPMLKSGQHS